jgi:hypothetical protein
MNYVDTTAIEVSSLNNVNATRLAKYLQGDEWYADQSEAVDTGNNTPLFRHVVFVEPDSASTGEFLNASCNRTAFPLWGAKPRVQTLVAKTLLDLYKSPLEVIQTNRIDTEVYIQAVRVRLGRHSVAKSEDKFMERVMRLEEKGNIDSALDLLYDQIDARLKAGKFEDTDKLLQKLNVAKLSIDLLLGVLTASLPARYKLPSRGVFSQ